MLHWALTAAAVLLLLFAIRTLFVAGKDEDGKGMAPGCVFAVVAAALWIYVLQHYFGDVSGAVRIGIGVLLAMPAVRAIARPRGASILAAAAGLILAVLIAGGPVVELATHYGPDRRPADVRYAEERIEELEGLRAQLVERREGLAGLRYEVKAELEQASGGSWEKIEADPALLGRLEVLRRVDDEARKADTALAAIDARLPKLRAELEAAKRAGESPETGGEGELEAWMDSLRAATPLDDLSIVEQHALKKELKELFESEF